MIDFHSHILPGMDDGSKDVAESLALLHMLAEQDVDTVVATPHFYANRESVLEFCHRRQDSFARLFKERFPGMPEIRLGAEVRYYEGISRMPGLRSLCTEGSKLLLMEMPLSRWTAYTVKELVDLSCSGDLTLVLAHIERYYSLQSSDVWYRLLESDILMQVNAGFFLDFRTARKAIRLLKRNAVHLLGSDCHNVTDRLPQIGNAAQRIQKKMGEEYWRHMMAYGYRILSATSD